MGIVLVYSQKAVSFFRNLGYSLAFSAGFASSSYAQEDAKQVPLQKETVQEKKQETQNLGTILRNYFDTDKRKSVSRIDKLELAGTTPWVIENGIEAVMNDGTKYVLDKKPAYSFVAVFKDNQWTGTVAVYSALKSVDMPEGKFEGLSAEDAANHAALLEKFFTLQEKMPYVPDPKDRPHDSNAQSPPKSMAQVPVVDSDESITAIQKSIKQAAVEISPTAPYILERLSSCGCSAKQEVHNDYCRFRAGMQTKDSGMLFRFDGKFTLGEQTSLSLDAVYQGQQGLEGAADYEKTETSLIARLASGNLNLWANGSQIEKTLSRMSTANSQPSPTLNQTTTRNEDDELANLHLAGKIDYLVTDNFMLRGKAYSITREDSIFIAQQDRVQGTVIVPGFGTVSVDDLILTNIETVTKSRERGGGVGFEYWMDKDISIMLLPERQAYTETVKLNGSTILEQDRTSWRLPARVQFAELVLHPEYRINDDEFLKDEWSGWAHYTAAFPSTLAFNIAVGLGENHHLFADKKDRAYYAAMFAFRRQGFNAKDVEMLRNYRDFTFDLPHDLTFTQEQRKRVARDAFEEVVHKTNAFVIDASRNHLDTRMLYSVKAGTPLTDWLTVLGEVAGARDYREWTVGARLNFWGVRIGPDFTKSKDSLNDIESLEALLSVTIGK